jgi:hypothetical protein
VIPTADATNVATHSTFTVVFSQPVVCAVHLRGSG